MKTVFFAPPTKRMRRFGTDFDRCDLKTNLRRAADNVHRDLNSETVIAGAPEIFSHAFH